MKIILSPAKKMNAVSDTLTHTGLPVYLDYADRILSWMKEKSYDELKRLWRCNDKIASWNFERLKDMDLRRGLTPAVLAYEGIAYQYMAPAVFEDGQFDYIQENLRILSGFYGVLKPMDGVVPYRLEMQAKAGIGDAKDLYGLWGGLLYEQVRDESGIIINLASKEYSKCVEKYLTGGDIYITCLFGEMEDGKLVVKGTYAKMARGEMVRFMAERRIEKPEEIKGFNRLGYGFQEGLSTETEYVFVKSGKGKAKI